jgi:dihydrofolate synthase/folylpolyglutamate synthase
MPPVAAERADYLETLQRLDSLGRFGVRLGLQRMEAALERLGHPERQLRTIHIAGTNGKGSTAAMLEACLRAAGYRTGLYTSPHLCRFTERIRVHGQEIPPRAVVALTRRVLGLGVELSFFEAVTAAGLAYFAEQGVEVAVVETGLGGRLDATNAVRPAVTVLTNIHLDHTDILGRDLRGIAGEKAGIIKPGTPVICAAGLPEVVEVVRERARVLGAPLFVRGEAFDCYRDGTCLAFAGERWRLGGLRLRLEGAHQQENAALCLGALEALAARGVAVSAEACAGGLGAVEWPGRLERIGRYLLDGAHNEAGMAALARAIEAGQEHCLVVGVLGDRPVREMLEPLRPLAGQIIFVPPCSPRAAAPAELARLVEGAEAATSLGEALERLSGDPRPILITGSLYLVGEARALLLGEPIDPWPTADPLGAVASHGVASQDLPPVKPLRT